MCFDKDVRFCKKWAPLGYCAKSHSVMSGKCKLACKMCSPGTKKQIKIGLFLQCTHSSIYFLIHRLPETAWALFSIINVVINLGD